MAGGVVPRERGGVCREGPGEGGIGGPREAAPARGEVESRGRAAATASAPAREAMRRGSESVGHQAHKPALAASTTSVQIAQYS